MAQREFSATSGGVLLASVVAIMLGPTGILLNTFSLFIAPMSAEYAWDRAEVSLLVTLFGLAVAITSPLKGWLIDRWGARRTMLGLTAALSLPLLGLAAVNAVWQLALFLLIGLLAPGNLPYGRILGLWFRQRLGVAYGLLGLGFGVGGPLGLLVGHQSLEAWGWRGAFLVYGVLELGLALPLLAWLFREPAPGAGVAAGTAVAETALSGSSAPQAWRSASFWLVLGNQVLAVFVMSGIMTHGVPMLVERGLSGRGGHRAVGVVGRHDAVAAADGLASRPRGDAAGGVALRPGGGARHGLVPGGRHTEQSMAGGVPGRPGRRRKAAPPSTC